MEREIVALVSAVLVVVVLVRLRIDLGLSMLIGAATLALIAGSGAVWTVRELGRAAIAKDTLVLLGRIVSIIALGALAGNLGYLDRLVSGLTGMIADNRAVIALMPAFGGLLPMPAGTMLTAPMVESASRAGNLSAEEKFFVNYWFRHIWEYIWPLYPGIIVSSALINRTVRDLFVANFPLTLAAVLGGTIFVLYRADAGKNVPGGRGQPRRTRRRNIADLLLGVWPFAAVIACVLKYRLELIVIAVVIMAILWIVERAPARELLRAVRKGAQLQIVALVIGVAAFQHVLTQTGVVEAVPHAFERAHMPELFVLFALPMIIGLITGVTLAFIAVTFPLLMPLMGGDDISMAMVMFAYAAGFVGVLLSPVHLCLVVSREYYGANLGKSYRLLVLPCATILAVATAIVLVAR